MKVRFTLQRSLPALLLVFVLLIGLAAGCSPIDPGSGSQDSLSPLSPDADISDYRGSPLVQPTATPRQDIPNTSANVFVYAGQSMMGFADWIDDTVFETTISLLADELIPFDTSFYRFDGYNIGLEAMQIPDAMTLRNVVREIEFFTSAGVLQEATIPSDVRRFNADVLDSLVEIEPWLPDEQRESAGVRNTFPIENAIANFSPDALNVIVTDLYELRNGTTGIFSELHNFDVGILAIQSEFSGVLPSFAAPGSDFVWGSPMTGTYRAHEVRTRAFTRADGTTGHYNFNVFEAYSLEERTSKLRTFYILFAGNADAIATAKNNLSSSLESRYRESETVNLVIEGLLIQRGFYSEVATNVTVDTLGAVEYIPLEFGEGFTDAFGFEIRADVDVPPIRVTAQYRVDTGATDRVIDIDDFLVTTDVISLTGATITDQIAPSPHFALQDNGGGVLTLTLTFNPDELPTGEFVFETWVSLLPPEQGDDESEFLENWEINVDTGTLRQWIESYLADVNNDSEQEGYDEEENEQNDGAIESVVRMENLMLRTLGLSNINIFSPAAADMSALDIFAVRLYFYVI